MDINPGEKKVIKIDAARKEVIRGLFILLLVIFVFLFLRLLLKLFGANPDTVFVGFIYLISGFFLLPFFGIFPQYNDLLPGRPAVDVVTLIALFSYFILIPLAMGVMYLGANIFKTIKKVDETVQHNNPVNEDSKAVTDTIK